MLTLHHLEYSQSYRVLWLLEELGADYELKIYDRDPQTRLAPADYKAISPLGTAPVITDGDLALSETSAIFDYILDQYPDSPLRPKPGSDARGDYLFWFHAAQGSLMPLLLITTVFLMAGKRSPFFIKPVVEKLRTQVGRAMIEPRLSALFEQAEQRLADTGWFAGKHLSAADMMLSYPIESAYEKGMLSDKYPKSCEWVERIRATRSYQAAKHKDGRETSVFSA